MLKKKKGSNPSVAGNSSGNYANSSSKTRNTAVIPAGADIENSGFDDSSSHTSCSNKTHIY